MDPGLLLASGWPSVQASQLAEVWQWGPEMLLPWALGVWIARWQQQLPILPLLWPIRPGL